MKREIFSRNTRFTHQFGDTEKVNDPCQIHTFDMPTPDPVRALGRLGHGRSQDLHVQRMGETGYRPASSPVQTPSGRMANIDGPAPDWPEMLGRPIPVGTKRRIGPLKTDK